MKLDGNYLWVATYGQGIYRFSFDEQKWFNYSTVNNNLDNDLFFAIEVSPNFVWAATTEGLFTLDRKRNKWTKRKFALGGEFGNWIRALKYDKKNDVLWIGRFRNITHFDIKRKRYTDINRIQGSDQKSNNIKSIAFDGDSLVWFGSESGVHKFNKKKKLNDPSAWMYISNKDRNFLGEGESVSVSDILFEGDNIWFGTDEFVTKENPTFNVGGIYLHNRKFIWDKISRVNGLGGNGIYTMARTGNYIWVGVYEFDRRDKKEFGKGLFLINRLSYEVIPVDLNEIKINSSTILSLLFESDSLWIGTDRGLVRLIISNQLARWNSNL
jgi:ligand-binding sensor domain-containing protein